MSDQIQLPQGFQTAGVACGIKESGNPDLSLFVSLRPATGVGVYTQNRVVGAPVVICRERTPSASIQAVVINSGNANACTGEQGLSDAKTMATVVGEALSFSGESVLVCSTGVIGHHLPMETVKQGIQAASAKLGESPDHLLSAARAIMTTDTVEKITSRSVVIDGHPVVVTGVAKGAAMIAPNMATMLCVIMTDYALDPVRGARELRQAVDRSFNCIIVEGHTSTSDTVLLLANGASEAGSIDAEPHAKFLTALQSVCQELSQKIIRDAEGAEHFVTVEVNGTASVDTARRIAKAVCESPLVKTAITGNDPNWGRIVSAAGYAGVPFSEGDLSLLINGQLIYESGQPLSFDEAGLSNSMKEGNVLIQLEFQLGPESVRYWTCDLTSEYIRLNADYTT